MGSLLAITGQIRDVLSNYSYAVFLVCYVYLLNLYTASIGDCDPCSMFSKRRGSSNKIPHDSTIGPLVGRKDLYYSKKTPQTKPMVYITQKGRPHPQILLSFLRSPHVSILFPSPAFSRA